MLALLWYKTSQISFSIVILHKVIEDRESSMFKKKIAIITRSSNQNPINGIKVSQISC